MIGKTVEWCFMELAKTGGIPRTGQGIAHAIGFDSEGHTWEGFVVLVELDSGELCSIPQGVSNMRVVLKDPTQ